MAVILASGNRCANINPITPVPQPISNICFGFIKFAQAPNNTASVPILKTPSG